MLSHALLGSWVQHVAHRQPGFVTQHLPMYRMMLKIMFKQMVVHAVEVISGVDTGLDATIKAIGGCSRITSSGDGCIVQRMPSTMRSESTVKVLAKCKLKYYRISECAVHLRKGSWGEALAEQRFAREAQQG